MSTRKFVQPILAAIVVTVVLTSHAAHAQQTASTNSALTDIQIRIYKARAARGIKAHNFQMAHVAIKTYLQHRPDDPEGIKIYADALLGLERYQDAVKVYAQLLKSKPGDVKLLYGFGFASEKAGDYAGAIRGYQGALAIDPKHAVCRNNLAWVLATAPESQLRNGPRSLALIEQSMQEIGREAWWLTDTAAAALAEMGNFQAAATMQQMAVNGAPTSNKAELRSRLKLYQQGQPFRLSK